MDHAAGAGEDRDTVQPPAGRTRAEAIAHELRQPLTALLVWARVARRAAIDSPTAVARIDRVIGSALRLDFLIAELLEGRPATASLPGTTPSDGGSGGDPGGDPGGGSGGDPGGGSGEDPGG